MGSDYVKHACKSLYTNSVWSKYFIMIYDSCLASTGCQIAQGFE